MLGCVEFTGLEVILKVLKIRSMDLEFVERCKKKFRIRNSEFRRKLRDLFATNVAHDKWIKGELIKKCLN
jgi:hypothetical protein